MRTLTARKWALVMSVIFLMIAVLTTYRLQLGHSHLAQVQSQAAWIAFLAAIAIWSLMSIVVRQQSRVQAQANELKKAQQEADAAQAEEKLFSELLAAELHTVTERMRLNMVTSQNRADNLYALGVFLMVASVFAPVVSAVVYLFTDPLGDATLQGLSTLRESFGGSLPDGLTVSVQRDWRLLLGGISFGFLFLAAARGLMTQHTRQTATYFNLANEVAHYENLKAIIRLRIKAASSTVGNPSKVYQT